MLYDRPWKSFEEQLELLKERGMTITDDDAAIRHLDRIGYYRLSAYWYTFRCFQYREDWSTEILDQYRDGTHFQDAVELYLFDKKLRQHLLDALERVEVAVRVDMAYWLGERDTFAYLDPGQFHTKFASKVNRFGQSQHQAWLDKYQGLLERSKEDFVKHYRAKYGGELPFWVAIEVWDFGAMSQLFAMMKVPDQQAIAAKYGVADWQVFASWLRSLNYLRNLCAHHSRLWNRNIIDQPKLPKTEGVLPFCDPFIGKPDLIAKPFPLLAITSYLVRQICPQTQWHQRLKELLLAFPEVQSARKVSIAEMGAVEGWEALL